MTAKLTIAIVMLLGTHETGYTSRYDEHVMDWQVAYHELTPPCDGCAIAVSDCSLIGDTWLIRPLSKKLHEWTPVIVADCAANDGTPQWMADNNIILELSYDLALRFGAMHSIEIEVIR